MIEDGAERVYLVPHLDRPVVNLGVSIVSAESGAVIDPWLLGSLDENDVQGEAGTPVDVNPLTFDFGLAIGSAGIRVPATEALLRLGRLDAGRLHGQAASRPVPPALLGQRSPPAEDQAAHAPRGGRPSDARRPGPGHRLGGRSVLDAHLLQGHRSRRDRLRLELRRCRLRAAILGPAAATREDARGLRRVGLPGSEEHRRASAPT